MTKETPVDLSALKKKLNLVENMLRFSVLTNIDSIVNSIDQELNNLKTLISAIPTDKDELIDFIDDVYDDGESSPIGITKMQRWKADLIACISNLTDISRSSETHVKGPIRSQIKALSGTRKHTLANY